MDKNMTPYAIETAIACLERTIKRLWILCILLVVMLVATNAGWIYYEAQFIDEVVTVEQENEDGYNNFIGNNGDINN